MVLNANVPKRARQGPERGNTAKVERERERKKEEEKEREREIDRTVGCKIQKNTPNLLITHRVVL